MKEVKNSTKMGITRAVQSLDDYELDAALTSAIKGDLEAVELRLARTKPRIGIERLVVKAWPDRELRKTRQDGQHVKLSGVFKPRLKKEKTMDAQKWSKIVEKARQEESAERARSFDPLRVPFMAAVNVRLMCDLFDKCEALQAELDALKNSLGIKVEEVSAECPQCGEPYNLRIEAGVAIGCQPNHCAIAEGRRTPNDLLKEKRQ